MLELDIEPPKTRAATYFNRKSSESVPLTYFTNWNVSGACNTSFSLRAFDVSVVSVIKNVRLDHLSQRAIGK